MLEKKTEKVPVVRPSTASRFFQLGRILSHGYMLTGYFPVCLSRPFEVVALVCGPYTAIPDEAMVTIMLMHLSKVHFNTEPIS